MSLTSRVVNAKPTKAGRTQTNNAQLYLAQPFLKRLSQEKLLCAGDC